MNFLTKTALKRPVSALLIVLAIAVFGISSIFGFKLELTPSMEMPMLYVLTIYNGGTPENTEELVTKVIEDNGKSLSGVDSIKSQSMANMSFVMFSYDYGTDIDEAHSDLRSMLETAKMSMPDDVKDPTIIEMNMDAQDVMTLSVTAKGDSDALSYVEDELQPELERISDIANISVSGGANEYIRIQLHPDKVKQYGLTMSGISAAISATDFTIPVGTMEQGTQDISASATSKPDAVLELNNVPITTSKGSIISLSDIATVSMANKDSTSVSRYNGSESISVGIGKAQSAGAVDVSKEVKSLIEEQMAKNPAIDIQIAYDSADSIVSSLWSVGQTLAIGVVFSMLVLFLFFGDIKASMIVGSSMPISLLVTLVAMSMAGFSLNLVTMSSLVIAIGMMVDSSIVVLESCFRLRDTHPDFKEAALLGTNTVGASVVASTLTTVVVYVPLATMKGLSGQMFSQLGFTIVFAMLASLIVALALIPIFFWMYKPQERKETPINHMLHKITDGYRTLLHHIMLKKKTVLLTAIVLLVISIFLATQLNMELMGETGADNVEFTVEMRSGTRVAVVDENIQFLEKMLADDPRFDSVEVSISDSKATLTGYRADDCKETANELVDEYNQKLAGTANLDITIATAGSSMSMMGGGSQVEIDLSSENLEDLKVGAQQLQDAMITVPGVIKASSDLTSDASEAKIHIDPYRCANEGTTAQQVAGAMRNASTGSDVMKMTIDATEYQVTLKYPEDMYQNLNDLMTLEISTQTGKTITLSDVASIEITDAPQTLVRNDGLYQVQVIAYTTADTKFSAQDEIKKLSEQIDFPEGVGTTQTMMNEMMGDEFNSIGKAIATAIFLIFLVMAMQFESPRFSLMVMLSIPFSMIGSFLLLFITNSTISMTSLMGFLMLIGIVVNNAILFIDTANQLKADMPLNEALIESGVIRIRPILMTTLTTILSMIPMIFTTDENAASMRGMALIIVGGLIASTLLILLLLPSFYLMMDKQGRREAKERKKGKKQARKEKKLAKKEAKVNQVETHDDGNKPQN